MKKLAVILMSAVMATSLFAAEKAKSTKSDGLGMYVKASTGYAFSAPCIKDVYFESNCFELDPAFGLFPLKGNKNFALEASLDMKFGGKGDYKTYVIAPKVMGLFYIPLESVLGIKNDKFTPYTGAGFALPIQTVEFSIGNFSWKETTTTLKMELVAGCRFKINDPFAVTADITASVFKPFEWSLRAGGIYNIK